MAARNCAFAFGLLRFHVFPRFPRFSDVFHSPASQVDRRMPTARGGGRRRACPRPSGTGLAHRGRGLEGRGTARRGHSVFLRRVRQPASTPGTRLSRIHARQPRHARGLRRLERAGDRALAPALHPCAHRRTRHARRGHDACRPAPAGARTRGIHGAGIHPRARPKTVVPWPARATPVA